MAECTVRYLELGEKLGKIADTMLLKRNASEAYQSQLMELQNQLKGMEKDNDKETKIY